MDSPPLTRAWAALRLAPEAPAPAAALADVLAEVDALLAETERLHLVTRQVQALALRALAQHALGEPAAALDSLARALDLAEPGGLVRAFLDLGPPLVALLRLAAAEGPPSAYRRRGRGRRPSRWWSRSRPGSSRCSTGFAGAGSTRRSPSTWSCRRRR